MAFIKVFKVMVSNYIFILVFASLTSLTKSFICPEKQYLHSKLQECLNCSECKNGTAVLRPCESHRDTYCAPIIDLLKTMETSNPHRHKHNNYHRKHRGEHEDSWKYGKDAVKDDNMAEQVAALEVADSELPFSNAEAIVWDWQAVALTSAVFACILFFLVITLYSLHQARQWRRLKENFDADVEELSARLSLMAASTSEKGELLEPTGISPISENYLNTRCMYLEHLLSVRKDGNKTCKIPKGNVYIEESNSKT